MAALMLSGSLAVASHHLGATTLYRWTDANGTPVISDRPPPQGTSYTTTEIGRSMSSGFAVSPESKPSTASSAGESGGTSGSLADTGAPKTMTTRAGTAAAAQCASLADEIYKLQTFTSIRLVNPDTGEVVPLTDAEREARLGKAMQLQSERC